MAEGLFCGYPQPTDICIQQAGDNSYLLVLISWKAAKKKKKKPRRPCPLCMLEFADLSRHLLTVHRKDTPVKGIIEDFETKVISRKDKIRRLAQLRKEGLYQKNRNNLAVGKRVEYLRLSGSSKPSFCKNCNGTYSGENFYKHRKLCTEKEGMSEYNPLKDCTPNSTIPEWKSAMTGKRVLKDELYDIIQQDSYIQLVGTRIYRNKKGKKKFKIKKTARRSMRSLASLVQVSGVESSLELFMPGNYYMLEEAIYTLTHTKTQTFLAGKQVNLLNLVKKAAKIIKTDLAVKERDELVKKVTTFIEMLKGDTGFLSGEAEYELAQKRQSENRKAKNLPKDEDLRKLHESLNDIMDEYSVKEELTKSEFVKLRKATVSSVTILNGRRGDEDSLITRNEFQQGSETEWITNQTDPMIKEYTVVYSMGKGTKEVSTVINKRQLRSMEMLNSERNRKNAGVSEENEYIFANTENSLDSCSGWADLQDMCKAAGLGPGVITATKKRHLISSQFWKMEGLPQETVDLFLKHMGHGKEISQNIYSIQQTERTLKAVVPILEQADPVSNYLMLCNKTCLSKISPLTLNAADSLQTKTKMYS